MKVFGMLAVLMSSLAAGELIEVAEVVKEDVPGARPLIYEKGENREALYLHASPMVTTGDVATVAASKDHTMVEVKLTDEGGKKFSEKTAVMKGKRVAVIVEGKVMCAPMIANAPLGGNFVISGFKDEAEVKAFVDAFAKREKK